ncbi:MAG TPA: hypothetical protein VIC07_09405 [Acidimicrobiia bacterium]
MAAPTIVDEREVVTAEPNPSRLDWGMGILSVLLVGGFFIDLWAHSHGRVDESFFTPWHAILYAAAGLFGGILLAIWLRNRRSGAAFAEALPAGYGLSLIGAGVFLAAGVGDLIWHEVFGIEQSVDALLSPTHLALATSGMMMVFGPVRSAWWKGPPLSFPLWLPWVLGMTMGLGILGAFTEYAHPAIDTWPEQVASFDAGRSELLMASADGNAQIRIPIDGADQVWLPDFAEDGRIVMSVVTGDTGRLVIMNGDGSDQQVLHEGPERFHHPEWSPDLSMIAYNAEIDGQAEIFVIPSEGGDPIRLTDDPATDWGPTWSPDGAHIVFGSDREGTPGLYRISAHGGEVETLYLDEGGAVSPSYSPDGEWIVFETNREGNSDIARIEPDGDGLTMLTSDSGNDLAPSWSPKGDLVAFASDRGGEFDVYLMAGDGTDVRNITRHPGADEGWGGTSWSSNLALIATNQSGHTPFWGEPFAREALGVAALLVQGALIAGFALLALRHGGLPLGSLTVMVGLSGALMTAISDNYWYIVVALVAGMAGDLVVRLARPSTERSWAIRLVAFLLPAVWYALYLVAIGVWGEGIGWSVHMTIGGPILAGIVGLLLSFLVFPGTAVSADRTAASA